MSEEKISNENYGFEYIYYEQANIYLFKFENEGDFFPPILIDYVNNLTNAEGTQISVAEEGDFEEYHTLVDMTLQDFKKHVLENPHDESE